MPNHFRKPPNTLKDYLLFIDTEASGLPRKWNKPHSSNGNWPFSVQISWLVYTKSGEEIKREDHYIVDDDFEIDPSAIKIHGITRELLKSKGERRADVLNILSADLQHYKPLVIGHFLELDYHVIAADYYRSGLENPITALSLPVFCTMLSTTTFVRNPSAKFMRLGDLFFALFNKKLENPHNAIIDAKATADCFFELVKKGDLTQQQIDTQHINLNPDQTEHRKLGFVLIALLVLLFILIISYGFSKTY